MITDKQARVYGGIMVAMNTPRFLEYLEARILQTLAPTADEIQNIMLDYLNQELKNI